MVDAKEMIATIKAMDERIKQYEKQIDALKQEVSNLKMDNWNKDQEISALRAELNNWRNAHS